MISQGNMGHVNASTKNPGYDLKSKEEIYVSISRELSN